MGLKKTGKGGWKRERTTYTQEGKKQGQEE